MSSSPKKWGDAQGLPIAMGKAAIRAIEKLQAPYLKASGPDFVARKIGAFNELETSVTASDAFLPRFWIENASPVGTQDFNNLASEDGLSWRVHSGSGAGLWMGAGCGISISHGGAEMMGRRGFFDANFSGGSDRVPLLGNPPIQRGVVHEREHYSAAITPWRFFLERWGIPGAVQKNGQSIEWDDGSWAGQAVKYNSFRVAGGSFVGPSTVSKNGILSYAMTTSVESGVDEYGFVVFQPMLVLVRSPVANLLGTNIQHLALNLAGVEPSLGALHSTLSSTPIMVSPTTGVFFVAELFQPQRLRYQAQVQPNNPASRLLMVNFSVETRNIVAHVIPNLSDYFADDPLPVRDSSHIPNDPAIPDGAQDAAYLPDSFDCLKNLQLGVWCSGGGGGVARADGTSIVWLVPRPYEEAGVAWRSLHVFVFGLSGNVIASQLLEPQLRSEDGSMRVIRIGLRSYLIMVRAMTDSRWWISNTNGESWEEINVSIGGIANPQHIGLPTVTDVRRSNGQVTIRVTAIEDTTDGPQVAIYESKDGMRTVRRMRRVYRIKNSDGFVFYPSSSRVEEQTMNWPHSRLNYYATGHARPQQMVTKNGRLCPVDILCPWLCDENYDKPQGV